MTEPVLTKDGQETLNFILNMMPPILREERKRKYFDIISLLMNKDSCEEAGRELVTEVTCPQ